MNGVPFPQAVQQKGSIGGPIVDLRLEELRKGQHFHDSRQMALEQAIVDLGMKLETQIRENLKVQREWHLGLGQDVENARLDLVKMLEAHEANDLERHIASLQAISSGYEALLSCVESTSTFAWEIFWASGYRWFKRKMRSAWERLKAPVWR